MQLIKKNKMHDESNRLLRNPEPYSANQTFDDVLSLTCRFHLIEPIVSKSENDNAALTNFLGFLVACGFGPISIKSLNFNGQWRPHTLTCGDLQVEGVESFETYPPVVQWSTVCALLVMSIVLNLETQQIDFINFFCQLDIDEARGSYMMKCPKDFGDPRGERHGTSIK